MLEFDGDGIVTTDITHDTVFVEGASDSVDPPLFFLHYVRVYHPL